MEVNDVNVTQDPKTRQEISALSQPELSRLDELEAVVRDGLQAFYTVGHALREIRDSRLYRECFETFDDYCRERWDISRVQGHRLISALEVREMLPAGNI